MAFVTPTSAPLKLSLNVTLHAVQIPLQVYDPVLTTPTRAFVWNFTVNLTGKDVGRDQFSFVMDIKGTNYMLLLSDQNLTAWLASSASKDGSNLAYWASTPGSFTINEGGTYNPHSIDALNFAPPSSGTYHIAFANPTAFQGVVNGVASSMHVEIRGYETWTTTATS